MAMRDCACARPVLVRLLLFLLLLITVNAAINAWQALSPR